MNRARFLWPAALIAALLLPFLLVDVPPVLDYPNHLARWFVLAHPDDPLLSRFYAANWRIIPNLGFDPIAMLLLKGLPVHIAGRLVLAASLLAPLLGALAYSRAAFGKWSSWPLAVTLTGFNGIFFLGFLNFLLAIGLAFAAAGGWLVLRRRGQNGRALLLGAVASALIFLCHIFGVGLFALLIGCQEISQKKPRGLLLILVALLPALALYFLSPLSGSSVGMAGWDASHKLWDLFTPFMTYNKGLTLVTGFAVLGALIFGWRKADFAPGTKLALGLLLLLYLAAPMSLKGGTFVDVRFALMLGLLIFAGLRPRLPAGTERWLMLGIVVLVALRSLYTGWAWVDHRKDLADLRAAISHVAPGTMVLAAQGDARAAVPSRLLPDTQAMDNHLPALLVIERRAFWPLLFADPAQQPLRVRPPYDLLSQQRSEPVPLSWLYQPLSPERLAAAPYLKNWRSDFDNVLAIDRSEYFTPPGLTPVYVSDYAALYRINR